MNTVSIEVAKELFELGWKKETHFIYFHREADDAYELICEASFDGYKAEKDDVYAPQLHEILDLLPYIIKKDDGAKYSFYYLHMDEEMDKRYRFVYENIIYGLFGHSDWNNNPHDAAAKLLIWCIKNQFVTL